MTEGEGAKSQQFENTLPHSNFKFLYFCVPDLSKPILFFPCTNFLVKPFPATSSLLYATDIANIKGLLLHCEIIILL